MIRPAEETKVAANQLASLLAGESGPQVARLLGGLIGSGAGAAAEGRTASVPALAVGIWEPRPEDGKTAWVRATDSHEKTLWADVQRIPPKDGRRRLAFLGESAARGYFYDPRFNPALALSAVLAAASSAPGWDVVDLARIDQGMKPLLDLSRACLALEPDAIVVFAGNNWHPFEFYRGEGPAERGSPEALARLRSAAERRMELDAQNAMDALGRLAAHAGVPVVFVLPENNLADWRFAVQHAPALAGDALRKWIEVRETARAAAAVGPGDPVVERAALDLMALDAGTNPVGPELLAHLHLARGNANEARRYLEIARDTGLFSAEPPSPRCYSVTQATIRREAARGGIRLCDLPAAFARALEGKLPGHDLFHDYCHMTVKGTQLAIQAVAAELLSVFGCAAADRPSVEAAVEVPPAVSAEASLLAAFHNARWGQDHDVIQAQLRAAVHHNPAAAGTLLRLLDCYLRRAPSFLCDSFEAIVRDGSAVMVNHLVTSARADKHISLGLVTAATDTLRPTVPSIDERVADVLAAEHGNSGGPIDLLNASYALSGLRIEKEWRRDHAFYRAFDSTTDFLLMVDEPASMDCEIAFRTPFATSGSLELFIDGHNVATVPAGLSWTTARFTLPAVALKCGPRILRLVWPIPDRAPAGITDDGLGEPALPVFGHIQALRLSAAEGHLNLSAGISERFETCCLTTVETGKRNPLPAATGGDKVHEADESGRLTSLPRPAGTRRQPYMENRP